MKFPFDHGPGDNSVDEGGPDVTSNVLDRLGLTDAKPDPPRTSFVVSLKGSGRVRFVAFLGMIILGSIAWRALSTSDDSIVLVETVPRTIENGRASRAQLFMGFMSPFEEIGRAITEVEEIRSPDLGIEGNGSYLGESDVFGSPIQQPGSSTTVDILEAAAPFPNS